MASFSGLPSRAWSYALWVTCVFTDILTASQATNGSGGALSDVMFHTIWRGYQSAVRPLCGGAYPSTTTVTMGIALRQLQELNEPKQILTTNLWLRVNWSECRLVWEEKDWNVSRLIVPYNSVWTPDLTLYDNAESGLTGIQAYRLAISHQGAVSQQVPVVVQSLCQLDISRFPFDTQTCNLSFGSWAYNGLELNLTSSDDPVDLTSFVTHGEWDVISLVAHRIEPFFFGVPYPQLIFTLVLKRKFLFYILSLLFPCAIIQLMACLAFLLPCETNEKVGLEITVLLSLSVMQLVVMDMIPASSETLPVLGIYFMLAMIVVSLSCLMTVSVLAVHYPNRHRPLPPRARAILRSKVARLFGIDLLAIQQRNGKHNKGGNIGPDVTTDMPHRQRTTSTHPHDPSLFELNTVFTTSLADVINPYDVINPFDVSHDDSNVSFSYSVEGDRGKRHTYRPSNADVPRPGERPEQRGGGGDLQDVVDICQKILDCMRSGKKHGDHQEKISSKAARREWELMAMFLDRVFLLVFCLLTFAMFTYVYVSIV